MAGGLVWLAGCTLLRVVYNRCWSWVVDFGPEWLDKEPKLREHAQPIAHKAGDYESPYWKMSYVNLCCVLTCMPDTAAWGMNLKRMIGTGDILNRVIVACRLKGLVWAVSALALMVGSGCAMQSVLNGWLDPTVLGDFEASKTTQIRASLTLEDMPQGIAGASRPVLGDLDVIAKDFSVSAGDTLEVEINELRARGTIYQTQVQVSPTGYVNLPVVGRIHAAGKTVPGFEASLVSTLQDEGILINPEVTVNPTFLQAATYSIFGVGVSASNTAPLRAGVFPISRPDLRVLEAINQVGGLNEFVTEIYVFRKDDLSVYDTRSQADRPVEVIEDLRPTEPAIAMPVDVADVGEQDKQELISAILDHDKPPAAQPEETEPKPQSQHQRDILSATDTDSTQAFLFVDGAFVRNPDFEGHAAAGSGEDFSPPTIDTVMPASNWARLAGNSPYRTILIDAEQLRRGEPEMNIVVHAGDVIRIVSGEIGQYYVMGQVNQPGQFRFNAESITLKSAIASAGGLSALAWPDRCTIYRRLGSREQMVQVDLDRIFSGKDSDFMVRRGDIINVGTHPLAPFLQRLRALTLPNITSNIGYGFTYSRNFADIDSFAVQSNPNNRPSRFQQLFP